MTDEIDFSIADGTNQEYTDVYPRIQWHHGKRQFAKLGGLVHTGGLFIANDQFPNFTAEGWQPDSFTSAKNEEIQGSYAARAEIAVLRVKTWWSENDEGKKSSQTHFLCCIKGVDGLFSLQVSGISKGQPMLRAFGEHRNQIVAMVNRTKPQGANSFEPYALWFVVEAGPHESQSSAKAADKSSEVTKPRLYVPADVNIDYARTLWVGRDKYQEFCQLYRDTEAWQKQIPKSAASDDAHNSDAPAFTGQDDGMTQGQLDLILGCIEVKHLDESDLKDVVFTATAGATNNYKNLTRDEATAVIDTLKAY